MTDLFDEVEEQLRSDRYKTMSLKALPWVIALLAAMLVAALGYWGWDSYQKNAASKASEQYAEGLQAFTTGDQTRAAEAWGEAAKSPSKGYKALALMQLGGMKIAQNKLDDAVALFDQAADAAPDAMIGDAARLKSAFALLDTKPYNEVEARLKPLMEDGRPYRVQAREAEAFARLLNSDTAGARADFVIISNTLDAPEGARTRAKAAMALIDSGSAKAVPAAVKAALAAPPMPAMPTIALPMDGSDQGQQPDQTQPQAPGQQ